MCLAQAETHKHKEKRQGTGIREGRERESQRDVCSFLCLRNSVKHENVRIVYIV